MLVCTVLAFAARAQAQSGSPADEGVPGSAPEAPSDAGQATDDEIATAVELALRSLALEADASTVLLDLPAPLGFDASDWTATDGSGAFDGVIGWSSDADALQAAGRSYLEAAVGSVFAGSARYADLEVYGAHLRQTQRRPTTNDEMLDRAWTDPVARAELFDRVERSLAAPAAIAPTPSTDWVPYAAPDYQPSSELAAFSSQWEYCGAGRSEGGLVTTDPGTCLNRGCFNHDRCYEHAEARTGRGIKIFSPPLACCDDALERRGQQCAADGDCGWKCKTVLYMVDRLREYYRGAEATTPTHRCP